MSWLLKPPFTCLCRRAAPALSIQGTACLQSCLDCSSKKAACVCACSGRCGVHVFKALRTRCCRLVGGPARARMARRCRASANWARLCDTDGRKHVHVVWAVCFSRCARGACLSLTLSLDDLSPCPFLVGEAGGGRESTQRAWSMAAPRALRA